LVPSPLAPDVPEDVFTANNASIRILGQVELSVHINGLIIDHTFIVLPTLFHECILGTDFLLKSHAKVDFHARFVTFYDDLTALPLLPLQTPGSLLRLAMGITIPPCSEVLTKVFMDRRYSPQLSIVEPLPTIGGRQLAVAKTLVHPAGSSTVCRLLNPTNAPISLPASTPVATIEPIDVKDVDNQRLLSGAPGQQTEFVRSVSSMPPVTHQDKLDELHKIGVPIKQDKLTYSQFAALTDFLYDNRDLFAQSIRDLPGTDIVTHTIDTTSEVPIRQRQFRHPPHLETEIDRQCKQLLDAGMIEHSDSPWNSPVFLIKKQSGEYRFILD
jgi:hypothetical protein